MTALAVKALSKSFGGLRVTANVNLAVAPGERRLVIGPNGAGKTTLFNLITGELSPDSGSVLLFDRDITYLPSRNRAHLGVARTYQIITLFARDTILRNVMLALLGLSPLRWNPVAAFDRQHQNGGCRIGMHRPDGRRDLRAQRSAGLDDHDHFLASLQRSVPPIVRHHTRQNVHAST